MSAKTGPPPAPSSRVQPLAPRRREEQRLETRNRLFQAALEEFRRVGFANAQIDRIAAAAGVARGTFYFHFPTKDHVLIDVMRRSEQSVVERLRRGRGKARSVRGFLEQVIDALLDDWEENFGDPVLMRDLLAMLLKPEIAIDYTSDPFLALLVEFFAEAVERGEVRDDISPWDMIIMFGSHLFVLMMSAGRPLAERRLAARRFVNVFIRGISP